MIIGDKTDQFSKDKTFVVGDYSICFLGFCYMHGFSSGHDSLLGFTNLLEKEGDISAVAPRLKGQYFIYLRNTKNNEKHCFTDESGNFHSFHSDKFVSDSFLELAKYLKLKSNEFDPLAIAEFIHWGNLHYNRTFFNEVKKIKGDQIISYDYGGKVKIISKKNCSIDIPNTNFSFYSYLESFCNSIKKERIVVDITGGVDSRLLVSTLQHFKLEFDLCVSGVKGNKDILIAEEIAKKLNKKLIICYHSIDNIEQELNDIYYITDGISNIVNYHRPYQLSMMRKENNYSLSISGAGGEIYKEFSWLTDFPFYNKKKANLYRYYNLRFCPLEPYHKLLAGRYQNASYELKNKIIQEWKISFIKRTNSETYDNLYYNYKWPIVAGRFITNLSKKVPCYAPYLELDLAKFTYSLPRKERIFNRLQRKWVSRFSPLISQIPTTEGGMTLYDSKTVIVYELAKYAMNRTRRLANKVGQKLLNKTYLAHDNPNHPNLLSSIKQLPSFRPAIELLKKEGIIDPSINVTEIEGRHIGSLLTLSKLIEDLG